MKNTFWCYCTLSIALSLLTQCHFPSKRKHRIPMRELSNQRVENTLADSLWQIPLPHDSIIN